MSHRYKNTLNMPKTPFPMRGNLPHREREIPSSWEQSDLFTSRFRRNGKGRPSTCCMTAFRIQALSCTSAQP